MNQATPGSIMVIGNDAHFCYLIQSYIRESSRQALISSLLDDALTLARSEQPAAIVMEIDHPGNLGWYLLRQLKAETLTNCIPVVLCSWLDEQKRGREEGAAACLRMPILYKDFVGVLTEIGLYACE
jgi:two-component system, chemotaxis family, response regulator PixH